MMKKTDFSKLSFAEQVDAALNGDDTETTHLVVTEHTPQVLQSVGMFDLPILMTAKHLRSITQANGAESMNYHNLSLETVKRLPELLSEPAMIFESLTRTDSLVAVTSAADKENRPVIGAIKIEGYGRIENTIIDANILLSVYGKDNFTSFLKRTIAENKLLYFDKEKSQALTVNPGIQFPNVMKALDFDTIIRKSRAIVNRKSKIEQKNLNKSEETKMSDKPNKTTQEQLKSIERPPKPQQSTKTMPAASPSDDQTERAAKSKTVWYKISLPITAIKARSDKSVKIDIPKADGEIGYVFWVNKNYIKHEVEKGFDLILPNCTPSGEPSKFTLKNGPDEKVMSAAELAEILKDYNTGEQELTTKPSEIFRKMNLRRLIATSDNFPPELKALPNFLVFKVRKDENGKFIKKLLDANRYDGVSWGKADDPQTWTTFDEAIKIAKNDNCSGVAFVLTKDSPYACIDLDHCIADGKYSETAAELIEKSKGTYSERSVSRNGVHIFFKSADLNLRTLNEDKTIEFFQNTNKVISLTGDMLPDSKKELIEYGLDCELVKALKSKLPEKVKEQESVRPRTQQSLKLSDAELIEKATASRDGAKFAALYKGENLNGNHSDSDMALMSRLAFWTGGDKQRMIAIFNTSGLARTNNEKPNYDSYIRTTAEKAIELNNGKSYNPKYKSEFRPIKPSGKNPNKGDNTK